MVATAAGVVVVLIDMLEHQGYNTYKYVLVCVKVWRYLHCKVDGQYNMVNGFVSLRNVCLIM